MSRPSKPSLILFALAALVISAILISRAGGLTSFTRDVRDETTYFRMIVHLRHAGEPVEADLVVACGARITRYRDGGSSFDTGLYPFRYAFAIAGGHALEIRTPAACSGQTTANGRVPKNFLPEVIWHERADDLSFGILYASDDAYANPRSQLAFGGAEILPATRRDFEHWLASAPENLIPRYYAGSLSGGAPRELRITPDLLGDTARYARLFGPPDACYAVLRLRIPEHLRPAIARYRPAGLPRYWTPAKDDRKAVEDLLYTSAGGADVPLFEGHSLKDYGLTEQRRGDGLHLRSGGGTLFDHRSKVQGPLFPFRSDSGVPWLTAELARSKTIYSDVEVAPDTQGFAYCFNGIMTIGSQVVGDLLGDQSFTPRDRTLLMRVNGEQVDGKFFAYDVFFNVFEGDEYLLRQRHF